MDKIVIAGTDTGIGKTVCSALLMSVLNGTYFKPIQSGNKEGNDTLTVKQISELGDEHFLKEKYVLSEPFSPHLAAEIDGIKLEECELALPDNIHYPPLIVELAGGLMVPVNRQLLMIDIIKNWGVNDNAKVILCARTTLGTINHALLSIEALKSRNIDIIGIVFIGEENQDNKKTIVQFSGVRNLGSIPILDNMNRIKLIDIFYDKFDVAYFRENYEI